MTQLLLFDLLNDMLSAPDTRAAEPGNAAPVLMGDSNLQCQVDPNRQVAQLIGKRCMVCTSINGVPLQMLLNSGTQVTMVGKAWMERELSSVKIQPIESIFTSQSMEITAVNGIEVPFEGWAEISLA